MMEHEITLDEHLSYEELERYTDGTADAGEREVTEAHLARCARCRAEAGDLAKLADAMRAPAKPRRSAWVAVAAVVAIAMSLLLLRSDDPPAPQPVVAPRAVESKPVVLTKPAILATLVRPAPVLRAGEAGAPFALRAPVATVVVDDRPRFEWDAVPDARSYEIAIADDAGALVARGTSEVTSWQPETALPRGKTYTWQVAARTPAGRVVSPGAAGAEALFHVSATEVTAQTPRERGIALAELGALDEAERELARAGAEDLLAQVRSWR